MASVSRPTSWLEILKWDSGRIDVHKGIGDVINDLCQIHRLMVFL
jgi:hypothetical protein